MDICKTLSFKLNEIADWQLKKDSNVELPSLQRGYVWKPKQVETLWDSLLRGYPIGAFLVARMKNSEVLSLLDGQQRATSIAMGFYNPWDDKQNVHFYQQRFNSSDNNEDKKAYEKKIPILWLDIGTKKEEQKGEKNDFKFLPRLTTQSHPWGYQKNGDKLHINERRKAKEKLDCIRINLKLKDDYPNYNLKYTFPHSATLPVPLAFIIEAFDEKTENKSWSDILIKKCICSLNHINQIKPNYFDEIKTHLSELEQKKEFIDSIFRLQSLQIPFTVLDKEALEDENNTSEDDSTLFVRINTLGTPLKDEELIYSIFKTHFPESKKIVEDAGAGFIAPSRIVSLISRLVLTEILEERETQNDKEINFNFPRPIKLKNFQVEIKKEDGIFRKKLTAFSCNQIVKFFFDNVKLLFIGDKNYQLPFPLAAQIASNSEIMFILIYWIKTQKIDVKNVILKDECLHKKVLAAITTLYWFGTHKTDKANLFLNELAKKEERWKFWDSKLFFEVQNKLKDENKIDDEKWLTYIPSPEDFRNILKSKFNNEWSKVIEEQKTGIHISIFNQFIGLFFKYDFRSFLLFSQRSFIKDSFQELQWDVMLDDMTRPWDWDHLYPSVYNQKGTYPEIRYVNNSIGNFRAWPFSLNRGDHDALPKVKIKYQPSENDTNNLEKETEKVKVNSFIKENDWQYWEKIDNTRITNEMDKAEIVCKAIYTRLCNIYEDWYNTLDVGKLFE